MNMKSLLCLPIIFLISAPAWTAGSPWLPIPKSGFVQLSYLTESAEEYYRGNTLVAASFQQIDQDTIWLDADYGWTDNLALDFQIGYSDVSTEAAWPPDRDGITDISLGVTWRVLDEYINLNAPSVALRLGATIGGGYDVGGPTDIGDDANGIDVSVIVGKIIGNWAALSGEIGCRTRDSNVPHETFLNAQAYLFASSQVTLRAQYYNAMASGSLDIGGPGFSPSRFPETVEDVERIGLGAIFNASPKLALGLHWFNVIDGRNTADFDTIAATFSYTFDLHRSGG